MASFSFHFERWLNDTLAELRRVSDARNKISNDTNHLDSYGRDSHTLDMSSDRTRTDNQHGGSALTNGGRSTRNGAPNKQGGKFYQISYNDDDALDIEDDDLDCDVIMSQEERVARILGKTEPEPETEQDGDGFYELSNGVLPDTNENFQTPDFRYSVSSLDFSDDLDQRSVTSEPRSFADGPEFMGDFKLEEDKLGGDKLDDEYVQIGRSESNGIKASRDRDSPGNQASPTDVNANGTGSRRLFGSVLKGRGREKPEAVESGFTVRYTKASDTTVDDYFDEVLRPVTPVGMTQEEVEESSKMRSISGGILPMPSFDLNMDSEAESMLDGGGSMDSRYGGFKGSRTSDKVPIVVMQPPDRVRWITKHRRVAIGVGAIAVLAILAVCSAVVYFILRFGRD